MSFICILDAGNYIIKNIICPLQQTDPFLGGDEIKVDEMDETRSMHGEDDKCRLNILSLTKRKIRLGDLNIDGKILKRIEKKEGVKRKLERAVLPQYD
jgi:hypothetical protein